jgi:PAS domain S-box-containing protein
VLFFETPMWGVLMPAALLDALERLGLHDHLCSVYESQDEQFASAAPFVRIGLERGERCIYVMDGDERFEPVSAALKAAGIEVDRVIRSGALVLTAKDAAHLEGSNFDPHKILNSWKEQTAEALRIGYSGLRLTGETDWVTQGRLGMESLMKYERLATRHFAETGCLALCQYDRRVCTPELILNVIRTHPIVIYGDRVCENCYYVPFDEFVEPDCTVREVERLLHSVHERERTVHELKLIRTLIDQSKDAIEVIDLETFRFLAVNEKACLDLGYSREELLSLSVFDIDSTLDQSLTKRIREELRKSGSVILETVYRRKDGSNFPAEINIKHIQLDRGYMVTVVRDITERKEAEEDLRQLSQQLLRTRDAERRQMARELHETAGQSLAALKMTLGRLRDALPEDDETARDLVEVSVELAEDAVREVRVVSYLMHPPMLDEGGLSLALPWYARGFSERSGVKTDVEIADDFGRYPQEIETTIFRVVQEALTNVHRYSGSRTVAIRLAREGGQIRAEVRDEGCGLVLPVPAKGWDASPLGVGVAGMRERVKQLHGVFEIESAPGRGTTVRAILPIPHEQASSTAAGEAPRDQRINMGSRETKEKRAVRSS